MGWSVDLKLRQNPRPGPAQGPRCNLLARCYRRPGCVVEADVWSLKMQRGASKNDNEIKGRGARQVAARVGRASDQQPAVGRTVGLEAGHSHIFERCAPCLNATARGAECGVAALGAVLCMCRLCGARMTDAGRPSTDTSLHSKGPRGAPPRHCRVVRPQGRAQQPTTAARAVHVPRGRTKK